MKRSERFPVAFRRACKAIGVPVFSVLARFSRGFAALAHKGFFYAEWCVDHPENFDQNIDLYYQWRKNHSSSWLEQGVYGVLALQTFQEPVLIELCCGEGFFTKMFFSAAARYIWACDIDERAIRRARRRNREDNVSFAVADIRRDIPDSVEGRAPTNVIWTEAMEYCTKDEMCGILERIHTVLSQTNGILYGQTVPAPPHGGVLVQKHQYEFLNKEELKSFLQRWFQHVVVFETVYEEIRHLCFWASDGVLPFYEGWEHGDIR